MVHNEERERQLTEKVKDDLNSRGSHVLVAEMNGEIVGFIHGKVTNRTDYSPKTVAHISTTYVLKKFRGTGVGTYLVKELCTFLRSEGVEQVTLRYIIGNREAERFWTRLGFKPLIMTAGTHQRIGINAQSKINRRQVGL
jgi:GNAT superfamily N-acetyltransferase